MLDQAQRLRQMVSKNKLSKVIDDFKKIKDVKRLFQLTEEKSKCKILSVFSAKGGTGKTSFIQNLIYTFFLKKKKVCILDLNEIFCDISTRIRNSEYVKLNKELLMSSKNIELDFEKDYLYIFQIDNKISTIKLELIRLSIKKLQLCNFDFILIDTPSMKLDEMLVLLEFSDLKFFVLDYDYLSLVNTLILFQNLNQFINNEKQSFNIVFNKIYNNDNKLIKYFDDYLNAENNDKLTITDILRLPYDEKFIKLNMYGENENYDILKTQMFLKVKKYFFDKYFID